jgi:hypothetical protein
MELITRKNALRIRGLRRKKEVKGLRGNQAIVVDDYDDGDRVTVDYNSSQRTEASPHPDTPPIIIESSPPRGNIVLVRSTPEIAPSQEEYGYEDDMDEEELGRLMDDHETGDRK